MFLFRSRTHQPGRKPLDSFPPLNAPAEEAAERTARHLAALRRMGELGMQLLERVAEEKLEAPKTPAEPAAKRPDPILAFDRISRCVRDTYAMEERIANAKPPAAPPPEPQEDSPSANDPRRPMIKTFLVEQIDASPHPRSVKADFRNQLDTLITEYLEEDLEQDHPPGYFVLEICQDLGLACTTSNMPDELLRRLHRDMTPEEKAAVAPIVHRRIYGHDPP